MRESFKFSMVPNVPANAEFFYLKDSTITCKRIGKSEKVRYNYGEYSLSAAAKVAYKNLYGKDVSLCGPEYWLYDGKTLNEWRVENEQRKADKIVAEHITVTKPNKEIVDFIENYPIVSLKNWGDTFYGYPEEVLEKMWNMIDGSEEEKIKKKICVLDDFGLQTHRFLIKKGVSSESIYFCISKDDESFLKIVKAVYSKLANGNKICSIFSLTNAFGDNNMFDLIIANPPYGNKGTIAADILDKTMNLGKDCVFLTPKTSFRYVEKTTFEKCGNFSDFFRGESFFEGANFTSKLVISHKSNQTKNPFKDYEDFATSHCKLYKNYRNFQLKNETDIKEIRLTFSTWHFTDEQVKDFTKDLPRERVFVATHRNISDGVHINEMSFDIQYNLKGADFRKQTDCVAYEFKTKEERDNFTNWYYSTGKSGLAEYLSKLVSYGGIVLHIWFPHIDWSYKRTDENIISELKEKDVFPKNWNFDDFQEDND